MKSSWQFSSFMTDHHWNRYFITGFPGAGNVIVNHLINELRKPEHIGEEPAPDNPTIGTMHGFADTFNYTQEIFASSVPKDWEANAYFQHAKRDKANFIIIHSDVRKILMLCDVSMGTYLNTPVHSNHEAPTELTVSFFGEKGYAPIIVVRHPLDILLSIATKASATNARFAQSLNLDFPDINQTAAEHGIDPKAFVTWSLLDDERWLKATATLLADFYRPALAQRDRINLVRYEDCVGNPVCFIDKLTDIMGINVTAEVAAEAATAIGTREFTPGHKNAPGTNKWAKVFSRKHLKLIDQTGLWEVFEVLGYDRPHDVGEGLGDFPWQSSKPLSARSANHWYLDFGLIGPMGLSHYMKAYEVPAPPSRWAGSHLVYGTDQAMVDDYVDALNATMLREMYQT